MLKIFVFLKNLSPVECLSRIRESWAEGKKKMQNCSTAHVLLYLRMYNTCVCAPGRVFFNMVCFFQASNVRDMANLSAPAHTNRWDHRVCIRLSGPRRSQKRLALFFSDNDCWLLRPQPPEFKSRMKMHDLLLFSEVYIINFKHEWIHPG